MPDQPEEKPVRDERPGAENEADAATQLLTLAHPSELLPARIRDVSFGFSLAGYSRARVDAFVEEVTQIVAELEVSRSPQTAVKLALDRVGEQTAGILQEAREAAEELTSSTLAEAEHVSRRAHVEADELMERARKESRALLETAAAESEELLADARHRLEKLRAEVDDVKRERARVLGELRETAAELEAFASQVDGGTPTAGDGSKGDGVGQPTDTVPTLEVPRADGARPQRSAGVPRAARP